MVEENFAISDDGNRKPVIYATWAVKLNLESPVMIKDPVVLRHSCAKPQS